MATTKTTTPDSDPRAVKAANILRSREYRRVEGEHPFTFAVMSSDFTREYRTTPEYCNCADHTFRKVTCKHMRAVGAFAALS